MKNLYTVPEEEINSKYGCSHGNSLGNYVARVWSYTNRVQSIETF